MTDKSLDIFLKLLFGLGGITLLVIAWVQPMLVSERVLTASVGSIGLGWVLARWLFSRTGKAAWQKVPAEVTVGERGS